MKTVIKRLGRLTTSSKRDPPLQPDEGIHKLCAELLEQIFTLVALSPCLPGKEDQIGWQAVTLSHVSCLWREVILSQADPWRQLPKIKLYGNTPSHVPFVTKFLERSKGKSLNLYVYAPNASIGSDHPVLERLFADSDRWEALRVDTTATTLQAFNCVKRHINQLRYLALDIHRVELLDKVEAFKVAPRLTDVTIAADYLVPDYVEGVKRLSLPYDQLETYREASRNHGTQTGIDLANGTQLKHLEIAAFDRQQFFPSSTVFHGLISLKLSLCNRAAHYPQFNEWRAPLLEELMILDCGPDALSLIRSWPQSTLTIRKLTLLRMSTSVHLDILLPCLPVLEDLEVETSSVFEVYHLTFTGKRKTLRRLVIHCNGNEQDYKIWNCELIAKELCERANPHNGDVRLETFQVLFETSKIRRDLQVSFNTKFVRKRPSAKEDILQSLEDSDKALSYFILEPDGKRHKAAMRQLDWLWTRLMDPNYDIIGAFYSFQIHVLLKGITRFGSKKLEVHRAKAEDLLTRWTPLLVDHTKLHRWFAKGNRSVVYIGTNATMTASDKLYIRDPPPTLEHGSELFSNIVEEMRGFSGN